MSNPFVTVGLPVTKVEYLKEAVQSLSKQTYTNFELIVLNNGVNEEIREQIHDILSDNYTKKNLRYYRNDIQLPVIENWNKCLSYALGELFILFSDDDIYHPDFIREMVELSDKYRDCNLFHCRIIQIDKQGKPTYVSPICPSHEGLLDFMWQRIKGYRSLFIPEFMCRTKNLREIGGFQDLPVAWGTDDITWFKIAKNGGVAYTQKVLCSWRLSGINISSIGNIHGRLSSLNIYISNVHTILEDIKPESIENKFLLDDIKKEIFIWKRKAQVELFRRYYLYNSYLKTLFLAMNYRFKRKIEFKTFSKVLFNSTISVFKVNSNPR